MESYRSWKTIGKYHGGRKEKACVGKGMIRERSEKEGR